MLILSYCIARQYFIASDCSLQYVPCVLQLHGIFKAFETCVLWTSFSTRAGPFEVLNDPFDEGWRKENTLVLQTSVRSIFRPMSRFQHITWIITVLYGAQQITPLKESLINDNPAAVSVSVMQSRPTGSVCLRVCVSGWVYSTCEWGHQTERTPEMSLH